MASTILAMAAAAVVLVLATCVEWRGTAHTVVISIGRRLLCVSLSA